MVSFRKHTARPYVAVVRGYYSLAFIFVNSGQMSNHNND
jgi:hypothetical protein